MADGLFSTGQPIYSAGTTQLNPNFASNASQVQTTVPMQQLNADYTNNANQIRTGIQDPNLIQQQVTDALYKQQTQFLDPQFERSQNALTNQLANQGITQGIQRSECEVRARHDGAVAGHRLAHAGAGRGAEHQKRHHPRGANGG